MIYNISGFSVYVDIEVEKMLRNQQYDSFRNNTLKEYECKVFCKFVEKIQIPLGCIVYEERKRLVVIQQEGVEHRLFFDGFFDDPVAHLEDYGDEKYLNINYKRKSYIDEMTLFNYMGLERNINERNHLILHSSFIKTKKGAILFSAPSGVGKSTQAELWKKYKDIEIINGDRACLWKSNNQWNADGIPWAGTSGILKNVSLPLLAIVLLEQNDQNVLDVPGLMTKMKYLMEQMTINPWNSKMKMRTQMLCIELCNDVPIYYLSCRPDKEAVELLAKELGL